MNTMKVRLKVALANELNTAGLDPQQISKVDTGKVIDRLLTVLEQPSAAMLDAALAKNNPGMGFVDTLAAGMAFQAMIKAARNG